MIAKFSVKKPLTVLVGVIIVIVLGVVSFMKMTPDLLPNINLPYAIVITTYPGASPEEVEAQISQPLEQTLATLDDIVNVTSQSSENYSMITLEFTDSADMNVAGVDIREKIDMISGNWNEMIASPIVMKINPNMMPVMMAGVTYEGKDVVELTDFLNDTLLNELEGTSGLASVTGMGMIEQGVHIILEQDKIDTVNAQIGAALDDTFADAQQELDDGKQELADGKQELADGKAELEDGRDGIAAGKEQLTAGHTEASKAFIEAEKAILAQQEEVEGQLEGLQAQIPPLEEGIAALDGVFALVDAQTALLEQKQQLEESLAVATDPVEIATLEATLAEINTQLPTMAEQLAQAGIAGSAEEQAAAVAGLKAQQELQKEGLAQLKELEGQLNDAVGQIEAGLAELELQKASTNFQMSGTLAELIATDFTLSSALTQMESTESQLDDAESQLDDAQEQLDDAKEDAKDAADMSKTITMSMVSQILSAQNFSMPAGYSTDSEGQQVLVRVGDKVADVEELEGLLLFDTGIDGANPIYLSDVATIVNVDSSDETYATLNGSDTVMLQFSKQSNYATADVSDALNEKFEDLSKKYDGLDFINLMDQGEYIYLIVNAVLQNVLIGAILAVLILLFFLKDWRPTLIIACSIPISVIFAVVLMYFSGITLNIISLSGLAVGVGMLVDNSVVVIENIYRLRNKGVSRFKAAVAGATQVAGAITASTLTTVCVFLPIVFIEGITRQLFQDMALTIGYALGASLIVALTVVPAMSRGMLRTERQVKHRLMDKVSAGYEKSIRFSLKHRALVLLVAVVVMIGSVPLSLSRGFSFMPTMESTQITVTATMPDEFEMADSVATTDILVERMGEIEGIDNVGAMIGGMDVTGMGGVDVGTVTMYALLTEGYSSTEIAKQIEACGEGTDATVSASGSMDMTSMMSGMAGEGVSVKLYGNDLDTLRETASELAGIIEGVEGIDTVNDGMEDATPELRITVDKNKAMKHGLTVAQIFQELSGVLTEETDAFDLNLGSTEATVTVTDDKQDDRAVDSLRNYEFTVTKKDGEKETVLLSDIATLTNTESLSSINRDAQRRYLTLSGTLEDGKNISLVTQDVQSALKGVDLPDGVSIEYAGENETIMEAMGQLLLMMLLAIILIYLIMVAQFQSLKSPFIVMFTVPLAFTGGLLALFVTGNDVSVISMIGFVMLSGIIVNNGIVLIDYVNQLREDGMSKFEALVDAGKTRMRPIMMTALTTILGLVAMAVGMGDGSEMMQPIAIVCIGGLLYATLMTLYVIPVMYDVMNRKETYDVVRDDELDYLED